MRNKPLAVILANFKSKWNPGWTNTQSHWIGSKDRFLLLNTSTGDAHLRDITSKKRIRDRTVWEINEGRGTDQALFYKVGFKSFILFGNSSNGRVIIYPLNDDAELGKPTFQSVWSVGWDNFQSYTSGGKTYLIITKSGTGDIHIHEMGSDGRVGTRTLDSELDKGWKIARTYRAGPEK